VGNAASPFGVSASALTAMAGAMGAVPWVDAELVRSRPGYQYQYPPRCITAVRVCDQAARHLVESSVEADAAECVLHSACRISAVDEPLIAGGGMRRITSAVSSGYVPCIGCTLATASTGLTLRTPHGEHRPWPPVPDPAASISPSIGEPSPVGPATTSYSGVPARGLRCRTRVTSGCIAVMLNYPSGLIDSGIRSSRRCLTA